MTLISLILSVYIAIVTLTRQIDCDDRFYCYGDICNSGKSNQFCSATFQMCRDCSAVRDDCGGVDQQRNCSLYCTGYLAELQLNKEKGKECGSVPVLENGLINGTNITSIEPLPQGTQANVVCQPGYKLFYQSQVTCGMYGLWEFAKPSCQVVTCPTPAILEHGLQIQTVTKSIYEYKEQFIHSACEEGYRIVGSATIECSEDGTWQTLDGKDAPVCKPIEIVDYKVIVLVGISSIEFIIIIILLATRIKRIGRQICTYLKTKIKLRKHLSKTKNDVEMVTVNPGISSVHEKETMPIEPTEICRLMSATEDVMETPSPEELQTGTCAVSSVHFRKTFTNGITLGDTEPVHLVVVNETTRPGSSCMNSVNGNNIINHGNIFVNDKSAKSVEKDTYTDNAVSLERNGMHRKVKEVNKIPTECTGQTCIPQQPEPEVKDTKD